MNDVLYSRAPLPLIPPAPFSHKGRRGNVGVLMPETEADRSGRGDGAPRRIGQGAACRREGDQSGHGMPCPDVV